jgi:peptidoglycan/xylan/chitin deacetylase (PgdA/CDA1 family)
MREEPIRVFLSHDVDWGKAGAPVPHILERRDRFDTVILEDLEEKNPYHNIEEILKIEEKHKVRSTFFFRTLIDSKYPPPAYNIWEYKSDIRNMISRGWEIGLHSDPMSVTNLTLLNEEKQVLEKVSGTKVIGNRTHFFVDEENHVQLLKNLSALGFSYDSSINYNRDRLTESNFGYFTKSGMIVFPISLMDAFLFRNLVREEQVLEKVMQAVTFCRNFPCKNILTVIWHNCSLKMKFGRRYNEVIKYLASEEYIEILTGTELLNSIKKQF